MTQQTMKRPTFKPWTTYIDARRDRESLQDNVEKASFQAMAGDDVQGKSTRMQRILTELRWRNLGSPYFKVWPGIAEALLNTKFEFTDEAFHPCFDAFAERKKQRL